MGFGCGGEGSYQCNPGLRIFYSDYDLYNNNKNSFQVLYRHIRSQALLKSSHMASCNLYVKIELKVA